MTKPRSPLFCRTLLWTPHDTTVCCTILHKEAENRRGGAIRLKPFLSVNGANKNRKLAEKSGEVKERKRRKTSPN